MKTPKAKQKPRGDKGGEFNKWMLKNRTLDEAGGEFEDHFMRALFLMPRLLQSGNPECFKIARNCLVMFDMIHPYLMKNPETQSVAFRLATELTNEITELCKLTARPAWLNTIIANGFMMPWMMINGKPAAGFPRGDTIIRRGKSQFVAPQTRQVAEVVCELNGSRLMYKGDVEVWCKGEPPSFVAEVRTIAALPRLSVKTKAQWWPLIRDRIKASPKLTATEKRSIRATLDHDTESALMNEYLKRCKIAFDGLCPKD